MAKRATRRVTNSTEATMQKLEEEAKEFARKVVPKPAPNKEKPLTSRQHLAGLVLAGLLARSTGLVSRSDLVREAYEWADYLLEE